MILSPKSIDEVSCHKNESSRLILKCGEVGQALLFADASVGSSVPAATISLNTSTICNQCIIFKFTSNVVGTQFQGTLNFQLFKYCGANPPIPIGSQFTITQPASAPVIFSDTVSFYVCDNSVCLDECCTYVMVVTVGGSAPVVGNIGIFATRLTAIIADKSHYNNDPCNKLIYKDNISVLKCGTLGAEISLVPGTQSSTEYTLSTLRLNTSCLNKTCTMLEFTSNIAYSSPTSIDSTVVNFQVYKQCDNQRYLLPVGPQYNFSVPFALPPVTTPGFSGTSTFSFFVCDTSICHDECCTYSVVATRATTDATVTITNPMLSAIATDNCLD